jgi:hypothetical protein
MHHQFNLHVLHLKALYIIPPKPFSSHVACFVSPSFASGQGDYHVRFPFSCERKDAKVVGLLLLLDG